MLELLPRSVAAAGVLAAAALAATPAGAATTPAAAASCSPDADLLGFGDALSKTTFDGTSVGGLDG